MSRYTKNILFPAALLLISGFAIAQEKKDIGTEVVNVVKPYTPTISDAFKIKETPTLNDSTTTKRKVVKYQIFSQPVASTFTPAKGKATGIARAKREKLYDSYIGFGLGNFTTAVLDFYTTRKISREEKLDISLNHHSSQGDIDGVVLDDKFFDTKLDLKYTKTTRDLSWEATGGVQHQLYNWYGLPQPGTFTDLELAAIDEQQTYYSGYLGAALSLEDSFFKGGDIQIRQSWDDFKSSETRAVINPTIQFPIEEETITATFTADYISGEFDRNYTTSDGLEYSFLKTGLSAGLVILRDDVTVNLGAAIYYGLDTDTNEDNVFVYPRVTASYRLVDEYVIVYGGVEGDLQQNSYYDFFQANKFISPTNIVAPTDMLYDGHIGLKGKLSGNVSYNLRGSYIVQNNRPLFVANAPNNVVNTDGYAYGNSFGVVYDDLKTIAAFGELNFDVNRSFKMGIKGTYYDYSTDLQLEAWNLPEFEASLLADYQIDKNWYLGANLFFTGERKDLFTPGGFVAAQTVNVKSYFDANAYLGYRISEKFTIFMNLNNIANQDYQRWQHYPVQGFQFLTGLTYGFDIK